MTDEVARLERMSTRELRERAVALARRRWDVRFFWRLLQSLPAAEAFAGHLDHSDSTVAQASGLFYEALAAETDQGVQEALRPIYVEYLAEHGEPEDIEEPHEAGEAGATDDGSGPDRESRT